MNTNPATVSITPDEAEFQKWKKAKGIDTGDDAEFQRWQAQQRILKKVTASPFERPKVADDTVVDDQPEPSYGGRFVRTLLNAAAGNPGMEAVMAGAGALGSRVTDTPMSYEDALQTLQHETGRIPAGRRRVGRVLGSTMTAPFLPENPAAAGAVYGGADQLLNADPNESGLERGARTLGGAAAGYLTGKTLDLAQAAGRTALTPSYAKSFNQQLAERARSAKQMFEAAKDQGNTRGATDAVNAFLAEPDVAPIVKNLTQSRSMQGAGVGDILDAIYKEFSGDVGGATRQITSGSTRTNSAFRTKADAQAAQRALLSAAETPQVTPTSVSPATAPLMRPAIEDYAERSRAMESMNKGYNAQRAGMQKGLPTAKGAATTSGPAFSRWVQGVDPSDVQAATSGIFGGAKDAISRGDSKLRALNTAASLARRTNTPAQRALDLLIKLGLVSANQAVVH